jgi:hypothetical protein
MDVDDALVFDKLIVVGARRAFGVNAQDRVAQPVQSEPAISKRDLRKQQNAEDDENYEPLFN